MAYSLPLALALLLFLGNGSAPAQEFIPDNVPLDTAKAASKGLGSMVAKESKGRLFALGPPPLLELEAMPANKGDAVGVHRRLPESWFAKGAWSNTPAGQPVWRLAVRSPGAKWVRLEIESLTAGELLVSGKGDSASADTVQAGAAHWTKIIAGDTAILEYTGERSAQPFDIAALAHGVRDFQVTPAEPEDPANRSLAAIVYEAEGYSRACSGVLLNTRSSVGTPYVLTLGECGVSHQAAPGTLVRLPGGEQVAEAEALVKGNAFALLRLPKAQEGYFLGWSTAHPEPESLRSLTDPAQPSSPMMARPGILAAIRIADSTVWFDEIYPLLRKFLEDTGNCEFTLNSPSVTFASEGGSGEIGISTAAGCGWSVSSGAAWIHVIKGSGAGRGTSSISVDANPSAEERTGHLTIAGRAVKVSQRGMARGTSQACQETEIEIGAPLHASLSADCLSKVRQGRFARRYRFQGQEGQRVVLAAESDKFDTFISLLDEKNQVLKQDDDGGEGSGSRIPTVHGSYRLPYTGTYRLEVTSARAASTGDFRLAACPGSTPINLPIGQSANGTLTTSSCLNTVFYTQLYSFTATAGQQIAIVMASTTIDSFLVLNAPDGTVLDSDDDSGGDLNSRIPATGFRTLPQSGTYIIEASTWEPQQTGSFLIQLFGNTTPPPPPTGSALRFVAVTPCRIMDTRAGSGKTGAFGAPTPTAGSTRDVPIPGVCDIPTTANAYSLNVTVVPLGPLSFLTAFPSGQTRPLASTLNSFDGRIVANAAIVPAGTNGSVSIFVTDATDVILDINGYFAP